MIKKVINKQNLNDPDQQKRDLAFWLSKPVQERIAAVEFLRRQHHGSATRLQRVVKVIQRP
jgi:hypothetical protein